MSDSFEQATADLAKATWEQEQEIVALRRQVEELSKDADGEHTINNALNGVNRRLKERAEAAEQQVKKLREAREAIEVERAKVSGEDGYNYAAGQEYGLRLALIKIDAALSMEGPDRG